MRSRPLAGITSWPLTLLFGYVVATGVSAQEWLQEQQVVVGTYGPNAHIELALHDDLVVVGVSNSSGGHVEIRWRHEGGQDNWGVLSAIDSSEPWFGYTLALHAGRLAIGAPGADALSGKVYLYTLDQGNVLVPVVAEGSIDQPDLLGGDRFGYSLCWFGDTLAVGAVARSTSFRTNGTVLLFKIGGGAITSIGQLPNDPNRSQIPFQRWFGAAITCSGDRMAVSAPFTGFRDTIADQHIGTLHLYRRNGQSAVGWALDTVLFDATLRNDPCVLFERVELGRRGMAFIGDQLVIDHSSQYSGSPGDLLVPWRSHVDGSDGCMECGLRVIPSDDMTWHLEEARTTTEPVAYDRSVNGWCVADDRLFVNWFDGSSQTWITSIHRRHVSGVDAWGIENGIPELNECDEMNGPIVVSGSAFIRTVQHEGDICGVAPGMFELKIQIFREQ